MQRTHLLLLLSLMCLLLVSPSAAPAADDDIRPWTPRREQNASTETTQRNESYQFTHTQDYQNPAAGTETIQSQPSEPLPSAPLPPTSDESFFDLVRRRWNELMDRIFHRTPQSAQVHKDQGKQIREMQAVQSSQKSEMHNEKQTVQNEQQEMRNSQRLQKEEIRNMQQQLRNEQKSFPKP